MKYNFYDRTVNDKSSCEFFTSNFILENATEHKNVNIYVLNKNLPFSTQDVFIYNIQLVI